MAKRKPASTAPMMLLLQHMLEHDVRIFETTIWERRKTMYVLLEGGGPSSTLDGGAKKNPDYFDFTQGLFNALRDRGWIEKTYERVSGAVYDTSVEPPLKICDNLVRYWGISLDGIRALDLL